MRRLMVGASLLILAFLPMTAAAQGGLSANSWPRVMAKLGRPANGDVVAIFALPDKAGR